MRFSGQKDFTVLAFTENTVSACRFKRGAKGFDVLKYTSSALDGANPSETWKKVLKDVDYNGETFLAVSGSLKNGTFFRTTTAALAPKSMKNALMFDLPLHMLAVPDDCRLQFMTVKENAGEADVNVYAFAPEDMERVAARLTQSIKKADAFIYPWLACADGEPPLYIPGIERDFYFSEGSWHPADTGADTALWNGEWRRLLSKTFNLPPWNDDEFAVYLPCLAAARIPASSGFKEKESGINVLPKQLRPSRLRTQIRIAAVLLILLMLNCAWTFAGEMARTHREFSTLIAKRNSLQSNTKAALKKLKADDKEMKDVMRVINAEAGEAEIPEKLAEISKVLPSDTMIMSLNWNDKDVNVTLRSEAESINIQSVFKPLGYWKVTNVQQRRFGNDTTSSIITFKLVPNDNAGGER